MFINKIFFSIFSSSSFSTRRIHCIVLRWVHLMYGFSAPERRTKFNFFNYIFITRPWHIEWQRKEVRAKEMRRRCIESNASPSISLAAETNCLTSTRPNYPPKKCSRFFFLSSTSSFFVAAIGIAFAFAAKTQRRFFVHVSGEMFVECELCNAQFLGLSRARESVVFWTIYLLHAKRICSLFYSAWRRSEKKRELLIEWGLLLGGASPGRMQIWMLVYIKKV